MPLFRRKPSMHVEQPIVTAQGSDRTLELYEYTVRIKGKGVADIMLSSITSTRLVPAGRLSSGVLTLFFPGRPQPAAFVSDPGVTFFKRSQQKQFELFKAELDRRILAIQVEAQSRISPSA